ncbi:probable E3 ubiquitin-protein ligase makorin-2 isoform X1 [Alligator sinensis]|uniref:RING-type E3 ubiquitin transferase n=1 Tax=Alligator sinensis TaxID=38654 RepID=A0A1U7S468_ALLSI|nr:probable E3 ubiquitin-protein ligase makorin-2 isoform X1 [Alligator sinensis]
MEPGAVVGAGGAQGSRGSCARVLCRNFARGACRWGQNCRFLHDRKSAQICRYFQNGFCGYGDRCSYQHIQENPGPAWSQCGSEPPLLSRRGSEPASVPEAIARSWGGGARRGSAPAVPSVTQLQLNFMYLSTEFEEEEYDKENVPDTQHPPDWALGSEFVPRQAQQDSGEGSRRGEMGPERAVLEPEVMSSKTILPSAHSMEAAGELGASAAAGVEMKSKDVVCGICMDKVYEKALPQERLFGILPNCSHAYCVGCISKWRKSRDFQNAVIKACPECRVMSSYFIPHKYWVSDTNEKEKLIETFKTRTGKIRCKFFVRGRGHCPFKSECIYLHELPRGQCPATRPPRHRPQRRGSPVVFNPSPSESSDEEGDDFFLVQWELTCALLQEGFGYLDNCREIFYCDSSDSE